MVFLDVIADVNNSTIDIWKFVQDLGPTVVAITAIIISLLVTKQTLKSQNQLNIRSLNAHKEGEARQLIQRKLNDFYGPLIQQRLRSFKLYQKFSQKYLNKDKSFSTLLYLLKGYKFEGNDKVLLEQIIKLGEESAILIQEKSGLIDDADLRHEIIPTATTHFLLLRLAYNSELKGDTECFKDLTYPHDLIDRLEVRKRQLEKELEILNKKEN